MMSATSHFVIDVNVRIPHVLSNRYRPSHSRGVVVILQAEGEVVVVLVGVGALGDLGQVVLVRRPSSGGRVRRKIGVVVRIVRLEMTMST